MKVKKIHDSGTMEIYSASASTVLELPYVEQGISAGFPSPAEDFTELRIDLNQELIENPTATFYSRVKGDSMKDAGLEDGDLLVIDKSVEPQDGKIAVCYIDGEFTVKRIKIKNKECWLMPANVKYQPIKITPENEFIVWGVVTYVIKTV